MEAFKVDFIKRVTHSAEPMLRGACCSFWPGQAEACIYGLAWGRGRTWPLKLCGCLCNILHGGLLPNLALYLKNSKDFALNLQRTGTFWRVGAICTNFKVPEAYLPIPPHPTRPLLGPFTLPPSTFLLLRVNRKTGGWSRSLGTSLSSWQSWWLTWFFYQIFTEHLQSYEPKNTRVIETCCCLRQGGDRDTEVGCKDS